MIANSTTPRCSYCQRALQTVPGRTWRAPNSPLAFGAAMVVGDARKRFLEGTLAEHYRIFEAVAAKNPDAAREAMRDHLKDTPAAFRYWLANNEPSTQR
ncbi:MAG: FCD domain-containing protein [Hyphomicrobiales bacterium]|nr:MAG: FCD domain-containing protein [Hyphomicrobiales bacterium]